MRFRDADGAISTALLGKDLNHWSFLLDTDGSVLYGNDWYDNGDYNCYQDLSVEIVVDKDTDTMIGDIIIELNALVVSGQDKAKVDNAVRYIGNVRSRVISADDDIDRNIQDILKAIDSLLSVSGIDLSDIRLMMDELLEVWEGRFYL